MNADYAGLAPKVQVFCSDRAHHSWPALDAWAMLNHAELTDDPGALRGGDLLLLVSCTQFIDRKTRDKYRSVFVVHESAVPEGRGWSPLAWQILEGRKKFTVSLIVAEDAIDSGAVIAQETMFLEGHELSDEINVARDAVRTGLMTIALGCIGEKGHSQVGQATKYRRRTPADSRLDPEKSIASQFELLRICESRFPAFFELRGHRYEMSLRKAA